MKFHLLRLLSWLALAKCALGTGVEFNANYEDLTANTVGGTTGVGKYNRLVYNSWVVITNANNLAGGVTPHSPDQAILTNLGLQLLNGTPSFEVATPYKKFNFKDFWFGCDISTEEGVGDVAGNCTITVKGFQKYRTKPTAVASFTFSTGIVDSLKKVPMIRAVLPSSFTGIYKATIELEEIFTRALILDNLHYVV